ncbi:MAG: peptide chain release factor N(5)-glutamine methyltransferase [Patescibacteria group bacterium]
MPGKTPRPTVSALLKSAAKDLKPKRITCAADKDIGELEAEVLLAFVLDRERSWLFAHGDGTIPATALSRFKKLVARRKKHEPVAYIVGEKNFYDLTFTVNRSTLIPRPESELLVDLARNALFPEPSAGDLVWDVGTGCGAIALAIAEHIKPRRVIATDVSAKALITAKQNATHLKIANVTFRNADLLSEDLVDFFDARRKNRLIIVANLPYLPTSDKKKLAPDVIKYEPSSALFVGKDGTELNEKFLRQLAAFGINFSSAFFEFDPPQSKKLRALAKLLFPEAAVKIHKDLAKRDRVLEITQR